ncbi:hypothetical protein Calab_1400 [Caldithrix abyssi DSM 13497]|uniref:DNA polymerase III alpha subunit n=1 Tax=Caldithrix abyssi DSM 13497 TaxID=880073 RepID=H1XP31_CALAY|nr:hypothetical protein [Caldithrix abyssi]APF20453.1 DNA polymerase III alpha subunit [Caldithrix abyssi DSM 13497]EHO41023.1 hypothetical protein Calab_1400 [Caldithrix abyssi DSM 13497]
MMKFITLEDRDGLVAVLFDNAYRHYGHLFNRSGSYVVKGSVQLPG